MKQPVTKAAINPIRALSTMDVFIGSLFYKFAGALMAVFVMIGAIFFQLFAPLDWLVTWVENGTSKLDNGLAKPCFLSCFLA